MSQTWPELVLVDADGQRRRILERAATRLGVAFRSIAGLPPCSEAPQKRPRVVVCALEASRPSLTALRGAFPAARAIVHGRDRSQAEAVSAFRLGADDFIPPDAADSEVAGVLAAHLPLKDEDGEEGGLVGDNPAFRAARDFAARLAPTQVSVLVSGETGTGKEGIATMLHRRSHRADRPLVALNCAAIPDALLEGELFGYERGAFSGALAAYPGKLKLADGGTLLLDEIGELSLAGQAKVLRAIETGEAWRLGARAATRFDVRIIAATNRDLAAEVAAGRFREDLFYRLAVARIVLPPLRDRREDIAPIARRLLRSLAVVHKRPHVRMDAAALALLERHDWPGNVRELRNLIEIALVTCTGSVIGAEHLPALVPPGGRQGSGGDERQQLLSALSTAGGNKSEAARTLRCSRMTLYRRMARHGLLALEPDALALRT